MFRIALVCLICLFASTAVAQPVAELPPQALGVIESWFDSVEAWLETELGLSAETAQSETGPSAAAAGETTPTTVSGEDPEGGLSIIPNG